METIWENSSLNSVQKLVKLAGVVIGRHDLGPSEPEDSGIDSDDTGPAARAALSLQLFGDDSSSDEPYEDMDESCPVHDVMDTDHNYGDMLGAVQEEDYRKLRLRPLVIQEETNSNRSSPLLFEVELTASDEDDDASVLELVIPMQSRYQRVPTSSPKKNKTKPPFWAMLFCCARK